MGILQGIMVVAEEFPAVVATAAIAEALGGASDEAADEAAAQPEPAGSGGPAEDKEEEQEDSHAHGYLRRYPRNGEVSEERGRRGIRVYILTKPHLHPSKWGLWVHYLMAP